MKADLERLVAAAEAARQRAYAPYSRFQVGAAVETEDGHVFAGANVENASYGLAICAERNAVMAAVLAGARRLSAVAVVTPTTPPAAPCGMCRQTLAEFAPDSTPVVMVGDGARATTTLGELLPRAFRKDALP